MVNKGDTVSIVTSNVRPDGESSAGRKLADGYQSPLRRHCAKNSPITVRDKCSDSEREPTARRKESEGVSIAPTFSPSAPGLPGGPSAPGFPCQPINSGRSAKSGIGLDVRCGMPRGWG